MDMLFDAFGTYETPSIILCNPGTTFVNGSPTLAYGELPIVSDVEIILNYNDMSEMNFRSYYMYTEDGMHETDAEKYIRNSYMELQKYKYVFVRGFGYFRIDNTTETIDGMSRTKDVHAVSCDVELKSVLIPYIQDGTYPLYGINQETGMYGIVNIVLSAVKNWSIGSVDQSIVSLNRSFTDIDVSKDVYTFLTNDVQEAYGCVVLFDILNRKIDVISKENIGYSTDIHLTGSDLVDLIKVSDSSDGPYTAFRVFGDDAVSISAVNPLGGNVVYDFSNFIPWMGDSLGAKVTEWQELVSNSETDYYNASVSYFEYKSLADNSLAEIARLNKQKDIYQVCRDNVVATQSTAPVVQTNDKLYEINADELELTNSISEMLDIIDEKIEEVDAEIDSETANYNEISDNVILYNRQRTAIHNSVDMNTYFSEYEMGILSSYIFEKTYTDSYITIDASSSVYSQIDNMDLIYDRAKNTLKTVCEPVKEFTIDTEDFMFSEKFLPWINQIKPACSIHIEISDLNIIKLFMSSIGINYEDRKTTLTFSNKLTKNDRRTLFSDLFRDVVTKTITNVRDNNTPYDDGE